jgi:hypothetical protein
VHSRPPRKTIPAVITTRLARAEKQRIEVSAAAAGLTLSEFVRKKLLASIEIDATHRVILAEVCATRKEVEALLGAISDLNDRDIDRARSAADLLRPALVEERILELQHAKGGPGDA